RSSFEVVFYKSPSPGRAPVPFGPPSPSPGYPRDPPSSAGRPPLACRQGPIRLQASHHALARFLLFPRLRRNRPVPPQRPENGLRSLRFFWQAQDCLPNRLIAPLGGGKHTIMSLVHSGKGHCGKGKEGSCEASRSSAGHPETLAPA